MGEAGCGWGGSSSGGEDWLEGGAGSAQDIRELWEEEGRGILGNERFPRNLIRGVRWCWASRRREGYIVRSWWWWWWWRWWWKSRKDGDYLVEW